LHVSVVHALLSAHVIGTKEHAPVSVLHESVVHALLSLQTGQRSRNPDWDPPDTPPLVHVASFSVASYPTTWSNRLTVASSSCVSTVIWNEKLHPVVSLAARRTGAENVNTTWLLTEPEPPAGRLDVKVTALPF